MGCGGSKVAADGQELAPRPRTQEAKGPPTNRPPSSRRQGSQRAPRTSASRGGSRRESRGGRSRRESRGGSSRSNRDSRHITDRPKTGAGLPTVEEQPASDSEIEHDINTLSTLIGHHAQNFYQSRGITLVNREIGMAMINRLITTTTSGKLPAPSIVHYTSSLDMINIDPLSLVLSLLDLVKLGNSLDHVEDQVKHFYEQLDETSELLDWVRGELDRFSHLLDPDYKERIEHRCDKAESALEKAKLFAEDRLKKASSERWVRNLKWVLRNQEIAQIHLTTLSNHGNELYSAIPTSLWCDLNPFVCLFPMQQMGNNGARFGRLDNRNPSLTMRADTASSRQQIFSELPTLTYDTYLEELEEQEERRYKEVQEIFAFVLRRGTLQ
ncbi:hypothetical protein FQN54_004416 [Arachnomyces sp. PD_36]|nr:hypothetical protein FQN54_004416 [Arachnomyces sp. PD_36]